MRRPRHLVAPLLAVVLLAAAALLPHTLAEQHHQQQPSQSQPARRPSADLDRASPPPLPFKELQLPAKLLPAHKKQELDERRRSAPPGVRSWRGPYWFGVSVTALATAGAIAELALPPPAQRAQVFFSSNVAWSRANVKTVYRKLLKPAEAFQRYVNETRDLYKAVKEYQVPIIGAFAVLFGSELFAENLDYYVGPVIDYIFPPRAEGRLAKRSPQVSSRRRYDSLKKVWRKIKSVARRMYALTFDLVRGLDARALARWFYRSALSLGRELRQVFDLVCELLAEFVTAPVFDAIDSLLWPFPCRCGRAECDQCNWFADIDARGNKPPPAESV